MKKLWEFLKSNFIVLKWTAWYFFIVWFILQHIFNFDMFSRIYWWKFFHAHLHGFIGFVFGVLIYTMIPIYIATTITVYRKKEMIINIPIIDKLCGFIKTVLTKIFVKSDQVEKSESEPELEQIINNSNAIEFPDKLPNEMRVPFTRVKQRNALLGTKLPFDYQQKLAEHNAEAQESVAESFPIPMDFDLSDTNNETDENIPTFKDLDFDTPEPPKQSNTVTKYFDEHKIIYEVYDDFILTKKHLIFVHSDPDFWIFDDDSWFAPGKQIDSPVSNMIELSHDNGLTPVIYFESTNIMDFDNIVKELTDKGIKVVTKLEDLGIN